jgi:hypothetical protein
MEYLHIIEDQVYDTIIRPEGSKDTFCYLAVDDSTIFRNCIFDGTVAEWGFKGSLKFGILFENCTFKNGKERAFDMVRGGNIYFKNCKWVNTTRPRTKGRFTLAKTCDLGMKAGMHDVTFENCQINDVLMGDYAIHTGRPPTRRFKFINCTNPNGGPIFVRGFDTDRKLILENTNVATWFWWPIAVKIYFTFCRLLGDKRPGQPIDPRELD